MFHYKPQELVPEDGSYDLEPAHNVNPPQLSSDAMRKQTRVKVDLITDHEMNRMLSNAMRRGMSMIRPRYSKENKSPNLHQQPGR